MKNCEKTKQPIVFTNIKSLSGLGLGFNAGFEMVKVKCFNINETHYKCFL